MRTVTSSPGCGHAWTASPGGHLADTELLEEQQAVGVGPVLCELAVSDAQDVGTGEADVPADGLGRRAGKAAAVGALRFPPHELTHPLSAWRPCISVVPVPVSGAA